MGTFCFLSHQTSLFINSISLFSDLFDIWALHSVSHLPFILFQSFCTLYFFGCWMLVTVDKTKFSLRKIPAFGWMLFTAHKIEFTSWKQLVTFTCSLTSVIIIFSKAKHVMFSGTKFQTGINKSQISSFLACPN